MEYVPQIIFDINNSGVATLTFNRPEKLNILTTQMIDEWIAILSDWQNNESVNVIVLTGAGKAFCAGGDANAMQDRSKIDALERKNFLWHKLHRIALLLEQIDKPIIACINGTARGAGMDIALMCDLRFIAESATLAESYINMGVIAGNGGTYYLPRIIGIDRALELFWTGRVIGSNEAMNLGLVTKVIPDQELLENTLQFAELIAHQPKAAIRTYKRAVYQSLGMSLSTHLDLISSHMSVLRDTDDHRNKVANFLNSTLKKNKSK